MLTREGDGAPLDDLDRRIICALVVNGRASWQRIARVLGTTDTTVARRATRLFEREVVRVVAVPDALRCGDGYPVLVQISCAVGSAPAVAKALAERGDVRFLALVAGGFDIVCELIVSSQRQLAEVMFTEIHGIPGIRSTTTEHVLQQYKVRSNYWDPQLLDDDAAAAIGGSEPDLSRPAKPLDDVDRQLIKLVQVDGRLSAAELATRLDMSESMARRRLDGLLSDGRVRVSTLVQRAMLGFGVELFVSMDVDLASLEEVAASLGAHREVRYLSATAGYSTLTSEVVLRDHADLYRFNTEVLAGLSGLRRVELGLELLTVKRSYTPIVRLDELPVAGEPST